MGMDEAINELSTAVSYFRLYQHYSDASSAPTQQEETPWVEDEWTEQDTIEAERMLEEAQERCSVSSSSRKQRSEPSRDWDMFYTQHSTNFYKDRNYLMNDFPNEFSQEPGVLVEIGCGVGNALLPLLQQGWTVFGLDFSSIAIDLLKQEPRFLRYNQRAHAHVWDITTPMQQHQQSSDDLPWLGVADVTTLLFCLSAIHPNDMVVAANNVASTLKPGGILLIRDYGRYDQAQLKLGTSRGKRVADNFYKKHDGTYCYYFCLEDLERLFGKNAGLEVLQLEYIRRIYYNHKTGERRRRVWVQARFLKPYVDDKRMTCE